MEQTNVILLDFSKAFDVVPHLRLLSKIRYYGIQNNLNRWISSFLESRSQQVLLDGSSSTSVPVESGVPQGSVLGPFLFLLYQNPLLDFLLMTVCCTIVSTLRKMPTSCRKTLMASRNWREIDSWNFICRSVRLCISPTKGSPLQYHIPYTGMY